MNDISDRKIKPCPFCGGEPSLYRNYNRRQGCWFVTVRCDLCNAQSGGIYHSDAMDEMTDEEFWNLDPCHRAIDKWNRRTTC